MPTPYKFILALFCLCLSVCTASLWAQHNPSWVHSIITDAQSEIVCKSMTQYIDKESRTIIVYNRNGLNAARFFFAGDMFHSLQKFSGEIFNASGKSIRKIKKSELQKSEYSTALTSDDYFLTYEYHSPSFPITVKYEWEVKCSNGLIAYPSFIPQDNFNQLVEKARYRIELPAGQSCRYFVQNTPNREITVKEVTGEQGQQVIEATALNLPPLPQEQFTPAHNKLFSHIYFAPSRFVFDKTEGDISTWQTYGDWQYKLLEGRHLLPDAFRNKLHELTANCRTDRDKVKAIYDYLAHTTRYVSIQLGIGGLQPIAAADVCRAGFGDCKGLSNYARAMLAEIGIPSTYTVISTDNERLLPDFSSANQMNHVILQVPLPQDTLWLECTAPSLPFGYIHQDIAGHDALLVRPTDSSIHRLPIYPDSLNTQCITATIRLSPTAEAQMEVSTTSRLFQYENEAGIVYLEPDKQKDRIRSGINLPQADILQLQINETKEANPSITCSYTAGSKQYGRRTDNRLFIPTNVFQKDFSVPREGKRTSPICIDYGYSDTDSIRIHLPEGYAIEGLPQPVELKNKFGRFRSTLHVANREILVVHQLYMHRETYAPEAYEAFVDFRRQVARQYNGEIILKKE